MANCELPILFSGEMVRQILAGVKTQTRRPIKFERGQEPENRPRSAPSEFREAEDLNVLWHCDWIGWNTWSWASEDAGCRCQVAARCPMGHHDYTVLWVRETWGVGSRPDPREGFRDGIEYRADEAGLDEHEDLPLYPAPSHIDLSNMHSGWRPSIHMPRWACRLLLEVTDISAARLSAITDDDIRAEGVTPREGETLREAWTRVWDALYPKQPMASDPWVWVVGFKVQTDREQATEPAPRAENPAPRSDDSAPRAGLG